MGRWPEREIHVHIVVRIIRKDNNMTTLTATAARRDFFDLVKGAANKHQVYHIHHRSGDAVLLSEDDYDSLIETLELLSIPGFRESIKRSVRQMNKGQTLSFDEVLGGVE